MKKLYIDIETAPHKVFVWGMWNQDVRENQVVEYGYTLCFAAKWEGKSEIHFYSVHEHGAEKMIQAAHDLLSEADAVVHYNGTKFDIPILQSEMVQMGLTPPATYVQIDLLRTVRGQFRFPRNGLDFVSQQLGLGKKVHHKGMELWVDCMNGCPKAWKVMQRYNEQDVRLLPRLYKKLLPWIKGHPNVTLYDLEKDGPSCPKCGSAHLHQKGLRMTATQVYRRYQCQRCGTWSRGKGTILSKEKRATTRVAI